jgi:hypothetical protein
MMSTIVERQHDLSSLRDSFAAAALTGLLSNIQTYQLVAVTRQAYDIADEMLVQRRPRPGTAAADKAIQDAKDFARIREQFEAWQKERSVGVAEMDSATDRKSAATPRACARSCSQPFDSASTTHDAVPEAKATNDGGTPKDADGTGNTLTLTDEEREAIAAIVHDAMRFDREANTPKWQAGNSNAESMARQAAWQIAGLLRATLTDEERDALEAAIAWMAPVGNYDFRLRTTLQSLLKRME